MLALVFFLVVGKNDLQPRQKSDDLLLGDDFAVEIRLLIQAGIVPLNQSRHTSTWVYTTGISYRVSVESNFLPEHGEQKYVQVHHTFIYLSPTDIGSNYFFSFSIAGTESFLAGRGANKSQRAVTQG